MVLMRMDALVSSTLVMLLSVASGAACGSDDDDPGGGAGDGPSGSMAENNVETTALMPLDEAQNAGFDFGADDTPTNEVEVVCAAQSAASEFRDVQLAFALDVSASMGQGNQRFNLKWRPIVEAAQAFFTEPDSAAISASLTFFPAPNENTWCTDAPYTNPNVPQTPLPSPAFGAAIAALNRTPNANWRTATPTLAVFNGTVASLRNFAAPLPSIAQAVVLVTDGVPQNCTQNANDVDQVAAAVRASGMLTYVVGVANPPGLDGGDNLDNLNVIAEAGGTERAFIVQTGDPLQTQADFKAVIDTIRGVSVSCNIEIPLPPEGANFIPEQVNVNVGSTGGESTRLSYAPSCERADGWRYDDPAAPASIVLCNDVCTNVQRDATATLNVEFGCERRTIPR
jgi:hypothetical protein